MYVVSLCIYCGHLCVCVCVHFLMCAHAVCVHVCVNTDNLASYLIAPNKAICHSSQPSAVQILVYTSRGLASVFSHVHAQCPITWTKHLCEFILLVNYEAHHTKEHSSIRCTGGPKLFTGDPPPTD